MAAEQQYSFIGFLSSNADEEYDATTFYGRDNLPTVNKRLSRPVTILASPPVIDAVFPPAGKTFTSPENATQLNEHIISKSINEMVSIELSLRLTDREIGLVSKRTMTPNEMFVDEMKREVAILQFYCDLIDNAKFDVTNTTMMSKARATTMHVSEMLRQLHNFEDVPDLPNVAKARVDEFLTRVEKLIEQKTSESSEGLEYNTSNSMAAVEFYLDMLSKGKFDAAKMIKPARASIANINTVIGKTSHIDKKSDYFRRAKDAADLLEKKIGELQV